MGGQLATYIQTYLSQGYDEQTLRQSLLSQGYAQNDIDAAFQEVNGTAQSAAKPNYLIVAVVLGILFIGLAGFGLFYVLGDSGPNPATPPRPTEIVKPPINEPPVQRPQTPDRFTPPIDDLPESVELPPLPEEPEPKSEYKPIVLVDDRQTLERQIEELAIQYPDDAAALCPEILSSSGQDACYSRIAILSEQEIYCNSVTSSEKKDLCYLQFPTEQIGTVIICESIQSGAYRSSCQKLYSLQNSAPSRDQFVSNEFI